MRRIVESPMSSDEGTRYENRVIKPVTMIASIQRRNIESSRLKIDVAEPN